MEKIKYLPSSSMKLDAELTHFCQLLIKTANDFKFDEEVLGIDDLKIIEAFIIEFMVDVKFEFQALLALNAMDSNTVILENSSILPEELVLHTYLQSQSLNMKIEGVSKSMLLRIRIKRLMNKIRINGFEFRDMLRERQLKTDELPPSPIDFLFESFYPNNTNTLIPLIGNTQTSGNSYFYLAARLQTYFLLSNRNIPNIGYASNRIPDKKINERKLGDFLKIFFEKFNNHWRSNGYFELQFKLKLVKRINQATGWYYKFKDLFERLKPKALVLSTGSSPDSRMLIQMAMQRNIPDYVISHGLILDSPSLVFQEMTCKFVWSQYQADIMNKYNPRVKCIISGSPKHDALLEKFKEKPGVSPFPRPYVLFPTSPPTNIIINQTTYNEILTQFIKASEQLPALLFVVKLHPAENEKLVKKYVDTLNINLSNIVITKSHDTYDLLYYSELVFVVGSAVGFEAFLFNKKIIAFEFNPGEQWYPFKPSPRFIYIKSFDHFKDDILGVIEDKREDIVNRKDYYFSSGGSMEIVFEYLTNDINKISH